MYLNFYRKDYPASMNFANKVDGNLKNDINKKIEYSIYKDWLGEKLKDIRPIR